MTNVLLTLLLVSAMILVLFWVIFTMTRGMAESWNKLTTKIAPDKKSKRKKWKKS